MQSNSEKEYMYMVMLKLWKHSSRHKLHILTLENWLILYMFAIAHVYLVAEFLWVVYSILLNM